MSGIAKPTVNFTNSLSPNTLVNVDDVHDAVSQDIPADPNGPANTARFNILITYRSQGGPTKSVTIPFATSAARNTSLTNLKTAITTAVA
jgi:hypothetical protein